MMMLSMTRVLRSALPSKSAQDITHAQDIMMRRAAASTLFHAILGVTYILAHTTYMFYRAIAVVRRPPDACLVSIRSLR